MSILSWSTTLILPKCRESTADMASQAYSFQFYDSIAEVNTLQWERMMPEGSTLFHPKYLQSLEAYAQGQAGFHYAVFMKENQPVGGAVFQTIVFQGSNVDTVDQPAPKTAGQQLKAWFSRRLTNWVNRREFTILINGNMLTTGDYGFFFTNEAQLSMPEQLQLTKDAAEELARQQASTRKVSSILIKDLFDDSMPDIAQQLDSSNYYGFRVQPNMILDIDPSWTAFDDYLGAMRSKYRTRMRKALKRMKGLQVRELTNSDLKAHMPRIKELFGQVIDKSDFTLLKCSLDYFISLQHQRPESFKVMGFFDADDQMLAFISYYLEGDDLLAGYTGFSHQHRDSHDLYLNILLQLVKDAFHNNSKRVIYGRTAMEIKSSTGAKPHEMTVFIKHRLAPMNYLIRKGIQLLNKTPQWQQRHPFKG